jgi:ribosomal protein S27AE
MAVSSSERLRFTKEQFMNSLCKMCAFPDNPVLVCSHRRERMYCGKCTTVGRSACKKTSLENESIFEGY